MLKRHLVEQGAQDSFDRTLRSDLCTNTLRPEVVKYQDEECRAIVVDVKYPSQNDRIRQTDVENRDKHSCFPRQIKKHGWKAQVFTFSCTPSGMIPAYSRDAFSALGFTWKEIHEILLQVVRRCLTANSRIASSLQGHSRGLQLL